MKNEKYKKLRIEFGGIRTIKKLENLIFKKEMKILNFKKEHILDSNPKHIVGNNQIDYFQHVNMLDELRHELSFSKELLEISKNSHY